MGPSAKKESGASHLTKLTRYETRVGRGTEGGGEEAAQPARGEVRLGGVVAVDERLWGAVAGPTIRGKRRTVRY